jgi:hypothetical protein
VERRKADKLLELFAWFEGRMLLGGSVLTDFCEIGRVAGETEHASSKAR